MGADTIPRYRLSGGSKLPVRQTDAAAQKNSIPTMKKRWGSAITDVLQEQGFVVDMRSGAYQQLGPVPGAVTVRVESVQEDGSRKVVSHFNKHYKGELARCLATSAEDAHDIDGVAEIAVSAGFRVETSPTQLTLVTS